MQYEITRKYIKNLIIRLDKNGNVKVSAPHWVKNSEIERFVQSKQDWIQSRKRQIINNIVRYENGAQIRYFDESLRLKIIHNKKTKIQQNGDVLEIYTSTSDIQKLVLSWYKMRSKDEIQDIIDKYKNTINREVAHIRFRNMMTRWGSCNHKRATITLNTNLFNKPKICFEYVLLHELIHLIHPNHGRGFYSILDLLMPQWKNARAILMRHT